MKKLNLFFCFIAFTLFSCSKDVTESLATSSDTDNFAISLSVIDGVLTFASDDDLMDFVRLDQEDQNRLLKAYSFENYYDHIAKINDEVLTVESEDEISQIINFYKGDLKVVSIDGENTVDTKTKGSHTYFSISNKDRMYGIANKLYKLDGTTVFRCDISQKEKLLKVSEENVNSISSEIEVFDRESHKRNDRIGDSFDHNATNNNPGCRNDRKIYVDIFFDQIILNGSFFLTSSYSIKARRRDYFCWNWLLYYTNITMNFNDVETISHNNLVDTHSFPTQTRYDSTIGSDHPIASFTGSYFSNPGFVSPIYELYHFSATHQGMAGQDLEVLYLR